MATSLPLHAAVMYLSNTADGTITKFDSAGVGTIFASGLGTNLRSLAADSSGNLFAATGGVNGDGLIYKFAPDGMRTTFATGVFQPDSMEFDATGNLYVADTARVLRYTPLGVVSVFASVNVNVARGLAFDSAGNLFVVSGVGPTIWKFTPAGTGTLFANTGLSGAREAAIDASGSLFVANEFHVEKFTPSGAASFFIGDGFAGGIISHATGLAFGDDGKLYVANAGNNTIYRFNSDGTGALFASTGLSFPQSIAFAIPEPTSWLLPVIAFPTLLARQTRARDSASRSSSSAPG